MRTIAMHLVRQTLAVSACVWLAQIAPAQSPKKIDFAHDIVPIIKARCAECHTNGTYKGSLSLETRESILEAEVVVPGKSGASDLIKRITSADPKVRMP